MIRPGSAGRRGAARSRLRPAHASSARRRVASPSQLPISARLLARPGRGTKRPAGGGGPASSRGARTDSPGSAPRRPSRRARPSTPRAPGLGCGREWAVRGSLAASATRGRSDGRDTAAVMRSVPTATRAAGASEQRSSALGLVAAPPHGELVECGWRAKRSGATACDGRTPPVRARAGHSGDDHGAPARGSGMASVSADTEPGASHAKRAERQGCAHATRSQARGSASPHIVAPASALAPRLAGDGDRRSGGRGRGSPREENARADERVERASLAAPVLVPRWWLVAGAAHGTTAGAELDTVGDAADAMGVAVQSTRGDSECEEEETCDAAFLLRHSMLPRIFQTPPLPATVRATRPRARAPTPARRAPTGQGPSGPRTNPVKGQAVRAPTRSSGPRACDCARARIAARASRRSRQRHTLGPANTQRLDAAALAPLADAKMAIMAC